MNIKKIEEKIDSIARFFLYVMIFWLAFSNAVIEIAVIVVFLLWCVKRSLQIPFNNLKDFNLKKKLQTIIENFKPRKSFLNLPIVVFLYVCLLSALWSRTPLYSLHGLVTKILEWFVIYFLVLEFFAQKSHIKIALLVFLFSSMSVCADSLIQVYITGQDIFCNSVSVGRATACFSTGNDLGGYLLFPLLLCLSLFFWKNDSKIKVVFLGAIFLLLAWALGTTLSRGAWLSFFVGVWVLLFLRNRLFSYLLILIFFVVAVNLFIILPSNTKQQMRVGSSEILATTSWRSDLWADSIKMIKDKPLLGHGPNTFMQTFREKKYRQRFMGLAEYSPAYAHNCYVQMAAEVGFLGLGCFLWIFVRFFKNVFKIIRDQQKNSKGDLGTTLFIGLVSGAAAFLAHSFVDTHFYSLRLSILFWVMAGLSIAIYNLLSQPGNYDIKGT